MSRNIISFQLLRKNRPSYWLLVIFVIGCFLFLFPVHPAYADTFTVNHSGDTDDANPGDGVCADSNGDCTLRAAIREANAFAGADTITFNSSLNGTDISLTISGNDDLAVVGDLDITSDLTITGNGASNTVINGTAMNDRVFEILSSNTVVFNNLTVTGGNATASDGGGIYNYGFTTLNQVQITSNTAVDEGGGIYNISFGGASLEINNSTIDKNVAGSDGGGIRSATSLTINNSTISGNSADGSGGGLYVDSNTATLNHVTVADNEANADAAGGGNGGGIHRFAGTLNIQNTILADNSVGTGGTGRQCSGTITTLDYNLIENTIGCTIILAANDTTGDPGLGILADNGGPTFTHALATNSPVVDLIPNGVNGCGTTYTTDQRGFTRPVDGDGNTTGECDVGALESLQICQVTDGSSYTLDTVTFDVQVGNAGDIDCFLAVPYSENHPNATLPLQTGAFWQLDAFNNSGTAASAYTLNLTIAGPFNFTPDANDKLCRYTGSGWDCAADSFTNSPDTITRNNVTVLSPWTGGNNAGPTAITLQTLTARSASTPVTLIAFAILSAALLLLIWRKRGDKGITQK